jgi:hypothetical protein
VCTLFSACGGTIQDESGKTPTLSESGQGQSQQGIYKIIDENGTASSTESGFIAAASGRTRTIFVNGNGGTYSPGQDDSRRNRSGIPPFTVNMPPYSKGAAKWSQFVTCVKKQFAPFNVVVTDQDPGNVAHIEALISGTPDMVNLEAGVGGISPMSPSCTTIENAVVWIFEQNLRSAEQDCEVAAQEIGHAIGMDHEFLCADPMTYLTGCGNKLFQDKTVACGEYAPRQCLCRNPQTGSASSQNSFEFMLGRLGPSQPAGGGAGDGGGSAGENGGAGNDGGAGAGGASGGSSGGDTTPPKVSIVSPGPSDTLMANSRVSVSVQATDDVGVTKVLLNWAFRNVSLPCDNSVADVTCVQNGSTYTWTFSVGTGSRTFSATAFDAAGNKTTTDPVTVTLGGGGAQPDDVKVTLVSPSDGDAINPGDIVTVVAQVEGQDISTVTLDWEAPNRAAQFPLTQQSDGSFAVRVQLDPNGESGARNLTVTARTVDGGKGSAKLSLTVP